MGRVVYIDESQRDGRYLLASMAIPAALVPKVRKDVLLLAPRGSGVVRRHFVRESEADRRKLLAAYKSLEGADHLVYVAERGERPLNQRERCLDLLIAELVGQGISRVVLDHMDDTHQRRDRSVLGRRLDGTRVSYVHEPAHSREPMLWVPDAIAWCAGHRAWRRELQGWVTIRRA